MVNYLFVIHIAAALAMTGLIWFVQVVHYPLFASVGEAAFAEYEQLHAQRTTWVVMPLMLTELLSGIALLIAGPVHSGYLQLAPQAIPQGTRLFVASLVMLVLLWASTFFVQMPLHRKLAGGFHLETVERLSLTNWVRTVLWTARSLILLALLAASFAAQRSGIASQG
jgi:hypothetical protein